VSSSSSGGGAVVARSAAAATPEDAAEGCMCSEGAHASNESLHTSRHAHACYMSPPFASAGTTLTCRPPPRRGCRTTASRREARRCGSMERARPALPAIGGGAGDSDLTPPGAGRLGDGDAHGRRRAEPDARCGPAPRRHLATYRATPLWPRVGRCHPPSRPAARTATPANDYGASGAGVQFDGGARGHGSSGKPRERQHFSRAPQLDLPPSFATRADAPTDSMYVLRFPTFRTRARTLRSLPTTAATARRPTAASFDRYTRLVLNSRAHPPPAVLSSAAWRG
jgi:hypothetical protein